MCGTRIAQLCAFCEDLRFRYRYHVDQWIVPYLQFPSYIECCARAGLIPAANVFYAHQQIRLFGPQGHVELQWRTTLR